MRWSKISARDTTPDERELKEEALDHVLDNKEDYQDQIDDGDVDYEALGAAVYVEQIVSGDRNDLDLTDVTDYIARSDIDEHRFVSYKADLADDYQEFVDTMEGFFSGMEDFVDDLEANGVMYQALYEEARNERDNAEEAMRRVSEFASDFDIDSDWLNPDTDTGDEPETPRVPGDVPGGTDDTDEGSDDRDDSDGGDCPGFSWGDLFGGGTGSEFSTWSNYNFGNQIIGPGFSTQSNYNFGNQTGFGGNGDGESEETEESEDHFEEIDEDWADNWVYNPQNVNVINVDVE